jgi:hypothetical protein
MSVKFGLARCGTKDHEQYRPIAAIRIGCSASLYTGDCILLVENQLLSIARCEDLAAVSVLVLVVAAGNLDTIE